jgi:hypothetical protein
MSLFFTAIRTKDRPACRLVAIPTTPTQFLIASNKCFVSLKTDHHQVNICGSTSDTAKAYTVTTG